MTFFPAEWHRQSVVQLTFPHEKTDWKDMLDEVIPCYVEIAAVISQYQKLLIVCQNIDEVKKYLSHINISNIIFRQIPSNDTWARDHGAISVFENGIPTIYDFAFNGWGGKFEASLDNEITKKLYDQQTFLPTVKYRDKLNFVLEGGSIESDGRGAILTTSKCLLSKNRNKKTKKKIEQYLLDTFAVKRILWLNHGYLSGDDTDSHIDTLARFCDENTIAFVECNDEADEHFEELNKMKHELTLFKTLEGKPYRLIALPMADFVEENGERLPATYANFLIMNEIVLMPFYNSPKDNLAKLQLEKAFPSRKVIGINCLPLVKQHGSLHCITMQYPENFV